MFYILIMILTVGLSFFLFKLAIGNMKISQLNIVSLNYYLYLFLFLVPGVLLVTLNLDNHYGINKISNDEIKTSVFFATIFLLIFLPLSMNFINYFLKFDAKREIEIYNARTIEDTFSQKDTAVFITLCFFTFISIISILYCYYTVKLIPQAYIFYNEESLFIAQLRNQISRSFSGNIYIKNIFSLLLTVLLSNITYAYRLTKKHNMWKYLNILLIFLSIVILTFDLSKAPLIFYFIGLFIVRIYVKGKVNLKRILYIALSLIIIIAFLYKFIMKFDDSFFSYNVGPMGRIIFGQITGLYYMFDLYGNTLPFLKFNIFPEFFGGSNIRPSRVVMEIKNTFAVRNGTAGVINTIFIGELYAAFNWLGIFIGTTIVGFIVQIIYIISIKLPKNALNIGVISYIAIRLPFAGGFVEFLYNINLIITIMFVFSILIVSKTIHNYFIYERGGL